MDHSERLLHLLLHELRTPLGTACGYARLLSDNLLPTPDERDRALVAMQKALGGITQLCDDASAFLTPVGRLPASRIDARILADWVGAVLSSRGFQVAADGGPSAGTVTLGGTLDAVADAIGRLAARVAREVSRLIVTVDSSQPQLRFIIGPETAHDLAFEAAFDPWLGKYKIEILLACRAIEAAGGRIWSASPGTAALAVTFSTEGDLS